MRHCYDISAVFGKIPQIMGLDLTFKRGQWKGKYYINREPHPRRRDKLSVWIRDGSIFVGEEGGETLTLQKWLVTFGGCADYAEAYKVLDEQQPMRFLPFIPHKRHVEIKYISREVLSAYTQGKTANNALYGYMCRMFGAESVEKVWKMYDVFTDVRGDALFWYIDREGRICHDKVMTYKPDGHRDKRFNPWSKFKAADGYNGMCLYGENLLKDWDGRVAVVESEKTALLCSCVWDDVRFVATGGISNIGLAKKDWVLLPDIDGADEWKKHGIVSEWWKGWKNAPPKADIGDLIEAYSRARRIDVLRRAKDKALFNY